MLSMAISLSNYRYVEEASVGCVFFTSSYCQLICLPIWKMKTKQNETKNSIGFSCLRCQFNFLRRFSLYFIFCFSVFSFGRSDLITISEANTNAFLLNDRHNSNVSAENHKQFIQIQTKHARKDRKQLELEHDEPQRVTAFYVSVDQMPITECKKATKDANDFKWHEEKKSSRQFHSFSFALCGLETVTAVERNANETNRTETDGGRFHFENVASLGKHLIAICLSLFTSRRILHERCVSAMTRRRCYRFDFSNAKIQLTKKKKENLIFKVKFPLRIERISSSWCIEFGEDRLSCRTQTIAGISVDFPSKNKRPKLKRIDFVFSAIVSTTKRANEINRMRPNRNERLMMSSCGVYGQRNTARKYMVCCWFRIDQFIETKREFIFNLIFPHISIVVVFIPEFFFFCVVFSCRLSSHSDRRDDVRQLFAQSQRCQWPPNEMKNTRKKKNPNRLKRKMSNKFCLPNRTTLLLLSLDVRLVIRLPSIVLFDWNFSLVRKMFDSFCCCCQIHLSVCLFLCSVCVAHCNCKFMDDKIQCNWIMFSMQIFNYSFVHRAKSIRIYFFSIFTVAHLRATRFICSFLFSSDN